MKIYKIVLICLVFHRCAIFSNAIETDFSMLTTNQTQTWLRAIAEINNSDRSPDVHIIEWNHDIDISIYNDRNNVTDENRHLFRQNINRQVQSYLYENQLNTSIPTNAYDKCRGSLSINDADQSVAGIYVYTGNETSHGLGMIVVDVTSSFDWYNDSRLIALDDEAQLSNGTQFKLGFETTVFYNSNSDLPKFNKHIDNIIKQATVSVDNDENDKIQLFFLMENLSCQRHQRIVFNDLRSLILACTIDVTFRCPLGTGSTCWIENKKFSNIRLQIEYRSFTSDRTISVRIDV